MTDADHFGDYQLRQRRFAPIVIGLASESLIGFQFGIADRLRRNIHSSLYLRPGLGALGALMRLIYLP